MDRGFEWIMFDEFLSCIEDYGFETELEEKEFYEILWKKLPTLDIINSEDFTNDYCNRVTVTRIYNPVAKRYE